MSIVLVSPTEIAFNLFGLPIYCYGICMAIAALVGFYVSYFIAKKYYKDVIDADVLFNLVSVVIIAGIICARLYYCIINHAYYTEHFTDILNIRQGGLSIHGGILGGFLAGVIYCKHFKLPIFKMADIIAYGLVLAQAIGRWGNFFNSEAYGLPTNGFIKVFIPEASRVAGYETFQYFHPTFLYESILNILIFLILFFVIRKLKFKFDGLIFAYYLILYSIVRFYIEGLRLDNIVSIAHLHIAQVVSLIIIVCASLFIVIKSMKLKKD